ncbi:MAG: hypothetical protein KKB51_12010 [Candidatus Riflebacteria bacterium]|nr:hypothetical protein [Candidatus Riflebacteria bacterium]
MRPTRTVQKICGVFALCLGVCSSGFTAVDNKNASLGAWVNDTQFEFQSRESYQNSLLLNDQNDPPEKRGPLQLLEKNPLFQSLRETGENILERFDLKEGSSDKRWIIPIFSAEKRERMQQPRYSSSDLPRSNADDDKRDSQSERYLIGYRLNRPTERSQPSWMLGFGFKKGGRDSQMSRTDNTAPEQTKPGLLTSLNNSDEESRAKKQEFSGPIIGVTGEF